MHTPVHVHTHTHACTHTHTHTHTVILTWFVDDKVADAVLHNPKQMLIEEDQVECCPERLPDALLDDNVDVHIVRQYFTNDAWMVVEDVVRQKVSHPVYVCRICFHDLHEAESIACDHCLSWFHVKCTALKKTPKQKYWFCRKCHESFFSD